MNITNDPMSFSDCPRDYSLANHRTDAIVLVGINILSCFLGTIGNLLVFMTVFNTPAMNQSSFHYFVSSLAMSDLINALVSQPLLVVLIAGRASSLCLPVIHRTFRWISNIAFGTSHLTLLLISLDRCLTVSGKFNYKKTMTVGKKATLVMIWLLAFAHAAIRITSNTENVTFFVYAIVGLSYAFYAFVLYKIFKHDYYLPKPQKKNTEEHRYRRGHTDPRESHCRDLGYDFILPHSFMGTTFLPQHNATRKALWLTVLYNGNLFIFCLGF